MDNLGTPPEYVDHNGELVQELPRVEVLARLYALSSAYDAAGGRSGVMCPTSMSGAADGLTAPHKLAFGCCRQEAPAA